jgi:steroid delta-isomerase-like uncharacterized protein
MPNPALMFTIRSYFQRIDTDQLPLLAAFAAPDYRLHFAGIADPLNLEDATHLIAGFRAAFPDLRHDIERITERDGRIEVEAIASATQRGAFQGVPPSGRSVQVPTRHAFRFADGRIAEHWITVDIAEILRQIGGGSPAAYHGREAQRANVAAALRLYEEVINQEQKDVVDEIFAVDAILHDPFTGTGHGAEAFKGLLGLFDTAFPHHRVVVERVIAEGDYVAVLHTHHATHNGPFLGMPATGKSVIVNGLELFRFADGRIAEFWRKDDDASLLLQLGALPAPQSA